MDDLIEYLDTKRSVIRVMLYIFDSRESDDPTNSDRIWRSIGGSKRTVVDRIQELEEMNIIERTELENHYPYMKVINLTERGLRLAEALDQLRNVF